VLSELPGEWRTHLQRWRKVNRGKRSMIDGEPAPSRNDEYLLYQTLLGAWPFGPLDTVARDAFRNRIQAYMPKAIREAKERSSWINPDPAYEEAVTGFVAALFERAETNPFLADFLPFQQRIGRLGILNSLTQTLLKLTLPGVPDLYQGTELWDLSLVDPDNRRPVDWDARLRALAEVERLALASEPSAASAVRELLEQADNGWIKLHVMRQCLALRRHQPELFARGGYRPLSARGAHEQHVVAFARTHRGETLVVVAGRLYAALTGGGTRLPLGEVWDDTVLELSSAAPEFLNVLTGERLRAAEHDGLPVIELCGLFTSLPLAVLTSA
jgi:(1->4)-alpha-D-glucan 1-alpha-D-glucosylmutase